MSFMPVNHALVSEENGNVLIVCVLPQKKEEMDSLVMQQSQSHTQGLTPAHTHCAPTVPSASSWARTAQEPLGLPAQHTATHRKQAALKGCPAGRLLCCSCAVKSVLQRDY